MVKLLKRAIITEWKKYHNISLTVASTSGVVVLKKVENVLGRMTVNMSNTAISHILLHKIAYMGH